MLENFFLCPEMLQYLCHFEPKIPLRRHGRFGIFNSQGLNVGVNGYYTAL